MSISSDGILVYGLSFEEDEPSADDLAEHLGCVSETSGYSNPDADVDDGMDDEDRDEEFDFYDLEGPLHKLGLEVVTHCHYEHPMYIIGCGVHSAYRGSPKKVRQLPKPNAKQAKALAAIKRKFGGKLGVWLCSVMG